MNKQNDLDQFKFAYTNDFNYAYENKLLLELYAQRVIEKAVGEDVLELGLGHGYSALIFSRAFVNYSVIDGSPEIIELFKENNPDINIMMELSYFENFVTEERYDTIIAGFILEHVNDPVAILKKYKEYLKPDGKMFIAVPNATALNKRLGYEAGMIDDMFALSEADLQLGHKRLFCRDTLAELAVSCGFEVKSLEGLFLKPITTSQLSLLKLPEEVFKAMLVVGLEYPELSVGMLAELEVVA